MTDPEGAFNTSQTQATIEDINHPPDPAAGCGHHRKGRSTTLISGYRHVIRTMIPCPFTHSQLPQGATFDAGNRTFSWTPTYNQAGAYPITFTVTDPEGLSGSDAVLITVTPVNRAPVLDPVPNRSIAETKTLNFRVMGLDPDGDNLTYEAHNLPENATFDAGNSNLFLDAS